MRCQTIAKTLFDCSLDEVYLILSAWKAAKQARRKFQNSYPLGAAVELTNGRVFVGSQHHGPPLSPGSSHEALEAALKDLPADQFVVKVAVVGEHWPLNISGGCRDFLWHASGGKTILPVIASTLDLSEAKSEILGTLYPFHPKP